MHLLEAIMINILLICCSKLMFSTETWSQKTYLLTQIANSKFVTFLPINDAPSAIFGTVNKSLSFCNIITIVYFGAGQVEFYPFLCHLILSLGILFLCCWRIMQQQGGIMHLNYVALFSPSCALHNFLQILHILFLIAILFS